MGEALGVGNGANRPQLGNVSSTWMERRFCSRRQQTENLADFNEAVDYLNNKFGGSIPALKDRLAQRQEHYRSNGRGLDGQGGRLRTFTDDDLKKLELEALKESNSSLHTRLETMLNTCKCNVEQRLIIMQYGIDMVKDGNKVEFAVEVCKSMAILFANGIEEVLPKEIDPVRTVRNDRGMRTAVADKLRDVMQENGAKYGRVGAYLSSQPQGSWRDEPCALKYFLLSQREDGPNAYNTYYLRNETQESLERKFSQVAGPVGNPQRAEYERSITMYKAFTAIVLAKVNFAGKNPKTRTCKLYRQIDHQPLVRAYPGYGDLHEGGTFGGMKQGIADSTSLASPPIPWMHGAPPETTTQDTHEMNIPFSKIHFLYFMSNELCRGGDVREVVCDMSNVSVKIAQLVPPPI